MTHSLPISRRSLLIAAAAIFVSVLIFVQVRGSDHGDTIPVVENPATDLTDLYIFPSPENPDNVVLVMNVYGLVSPDQADDVFFGPDVLYEFNIDTNGDAVEDQVIQARFGAAQPNQRVQIAGPVAPSMKGTRSVFEHPFKTTGVINETFSPTSGMRVFAGVRSDPFFFDINQFCTILPDRCVPFTDQEPVENPNQPQATSWRSPENAQNFFQDLNVLSIVVELPKARLGGGQIGVWMTTNVRQ